LPNCNDVGCRDLWKNLPNFWWYIHIYAKKFRSVIG